MVAVDTNAICRAAHDSETDFLRAARPGIGVVAE